MADSADGAPDLYAQTKDAEREPPRSLGRALLKIGPGMILAGSIVGTGELIMTTHLGATVGFGLLWLVLFSCFIKVFVQIELGRHAVSSGETTLDSLSRMPVIGGAFLWWWLMMMLSTQAQLSAMVGGVGQAAHMLFPGVSTSLAESFGSEFIKARPEAPWGVLAAIATSIILAIGSYKIIEVGTLVMVVGFTLTTVTCLAFLPAGAITGADMKEGLSLRVPEGATMAAFAVFGITGCGAAELIAYPYWCIEKGYGRYIGAKTDSPEWLARAKGWVRVMNLDAWSCMLVYTVATLAFYTLGASILHAESKGKGLPQGIGAMLEMLSLMYVPMLGEVIARWFIIIGAFAVLYSTLFSATAANSRAAADFLQLKGFVTRNGASRQRWITGLCIAFPLMDLVLYLFVGNPLMLVMIGAIGQALTLPMIAITALYLRFKRSDERLRPAAWWDFFLLISTVTFFIAACYTLYDTYQKVSK